MIKSLKALSALLTYPTAELQQAAGEIGAVIDAGPKIPARVRDQLRTLLDELATGDLYDLQERYVLLFDRTPIAVAAPVRARAWREPRPRPSHD